MGDSYVSSLSTTELPSPPTPTISNAVLTPSPPASTSVSPLHVLLSFYLARLCTFNVHSLRALLRSAYRAAFMKDPMDVLVLTEVQCPFKKPGRSASNSHPDQELRRVRQRSRKEKKGDRLRPRRDRRLHLRAEPAHAGITMFNTNDGISRPPSKHEVRVACPSVKQG